MRSDEGDEGIGVMKKIEELADQRIISASKLAARLCHLASFARNLSPQSYPWSRLLLIRTIGLHLSPLALRAVEFEDG